MKRLTIALLGLALLSGPAAAAVKPHELRLQTTWSFRLAAIPARYGLAGEKVTVELTIGKDTKSPPALSKPPDGRWMVKLPPRNRRPSLLGRDNCHQG